MCWGMTLPDQIKRLQGMVHKLQKNIVDTQIGNWAILLQLDKYKDDIAKETCLGRENPIYYALSTKHSLRRWQCYKHNNTYK